jgi:hypothetical protein
VSCPSADAPAHRTQACCRCLRAEIEELQAEVARLKASAGDLVVASWKLGEQEERAKAIERARKLQKGAEAQAERFLAQLNKARDDNERLRKSIRQVIDWDSGEGLMDSGLTPELRALLEAELIS